MDIRENNKLEKMALEIPYEEFATFWESRFDQAELSVVNGELEMTARTNTGVEIRKVAGSRMILDVLEAWFKISICDLFVRKGVVWCIQPKGGKVKGDIWDDGRLRKAAFGIPYEEFATFWESRFDQAELSVVNGELEMTARTNTGIRTRKVAESRTILDVLEAGFAMGIGDLFIRKGIVWCIPLKDLEDA